ncbi:MAG: hypothetical protein P8R54_03390 [Myxococcota bacterium]|nr:hypothetical protein [Myxococcota bacterium]
MVSSAMALSLSVDTSILGTAASWNLQDIEYGDLEPLVVAVDKKSAYRLEVTLEEHASGVSVDMTIVSMKTSWRGKSTEQILSHPRMISPLGEEASIQQGYKTALRAEKMLFEVTLTAQD